MDNSARWFLAGIVVSLINTGLVIVFIGIPGITDRSDDSKVTVAEGTYVASVNAGGEITLQRTDAPAGSAAVTGEAQATAASGAAGEPAVAQPTPLLGVGGPSFAEVEQPLFLTAHDGVAYVAVGRFALHRVNLDGEVEDESLDGVDDLGGSRVLDVDVTREGIFYLLVSDGPLEWRVFRRGADEDEWEIATSSDASGFAAEAVALSATDTGVIYISANDPAGIIRVEPDLTLVRQWVSDTVVIGLDAAADDTRLLFAAPQAQPPRASTQIRQVRSNRTGPWASTYRACGVNAETSAEEANVVVPQLPRDVAIVDNAGDGQDTALVVDSLNHVVWFQHHLGDGEPLFGVACGRGSDDAHLNTPRAVAIDEDGNVFISDTGNNRVVILPRTEPLAEATAAAVATAAATASTASASEAGNEAPMMQVGIPEACPQGERCAEADRFSPRTLAVTAGETVTFDIRAISHQVAIYGPGTRPEDIDRTARGGIADTPGADRILTSTTNRVATSPALPFQAPPVQSWSWDTSGLEPGTYLLICTFEPHLDVGMYGFAIVE